MGNFYTNVTVLGPGREEVAEFLRQRRWSAYVSPTRERQTVVYDALADEQDTDRLARVARDLSERFSCPAFAVLDHDDSELWFELYERGARTAAFDSSSGERTGLRALCSAWGRSGAVLPLQLLLVVPMLFQSWRHGAIAKLLGLPPWSVNLGYRYLDEAEVILGGPDRAEFVSTR